MTTSLFPAAPAPADAAAHFAARLTFEIDVSDVHAALHDGVPGLVVIDSRSSDSWAQGHIPGAVHLPTDRIPADAHDLVPLATLVITYCWGPACNGATRAALAFARLGYQVKEMIGGYEYWAREGFAVRTDSGTRYRPVDPLTAPISAASCGC